MRNNKLEAIGKRIKKLRKEQNISAEELAASIGVSPATIYRYESADIANMGIDKIQPLVEALHTTPEYLMGWTDDPYDWDTDPDHRIETVPIAIWQELMQQYHDDPSEAWKAWKAMEEDARQENAKEMQPRQTTLEEKRLLVLARKAAELPEEQRERIIKTFEDAIDLYLSARGLKKEDS